MLYRPNIEECFEFAKKLDCEFIKEVLIKPEKNCNINDCHNNCYNSGYQTINGVFFGKDKHNVLHGFTHSIIIKDNIWIDITPTNLKLNMHVFANFKNKRNLQIQKYTYLDNSVYINTYMNNENLYYVYGLIDPCNNLPFYIGKGKDNRAFSHLNENINRNKIDNKRKFNKIKSIKSQGLEPFIEFYAQNIEDENLAYEIEESLIKKYGRKGYDDGGILLNICLSSRPPNHKGKTYDEIYGKEKAKKIIEYKTELQLIAGGYGPKRHTEETKKKISLKTKGKNNPRYGIKMSEELKQKISEKKKENKRLGRNCKNSKKIIITDINGNEYILYGQSELKSFCNQNNLSYSTFQSQILKKWPRSKRGKNKGWLAERT